MAAKTKTQTYEADKDYEVRVASVVTHRNTTLRPKHAYTIKGRVLNELPEDAIASATPV